MTQRSGDTFSRAIYSRSPAVIYIVGVTEEGGGFRRQTLNIKKSLVFIGLTYNTGLK